MTYPEAISFLGEARRFGVKLGLEPIHRLAGALGDPQQHLRFIHIAGTNGKGSTAAFCESCLRASGRRTGLYTSPHLVSVRERIQIDRCPIPEADFAAGMEIVRRAIDGMNDYSATFFEIMTALALWYFAREKVEWVVWETGLGGRLDATNIVRAEVCIITNIGLDHQQYLGNALGEIAAEKAAIIKLGTPVVSAVDPGEACEVMVRRAKAEACALTLVQRDRTTGAV
jgi:dihydrofolate synthase/folylpolyglutamate synthase